MNRFPFTLRLLIALNMLAVFRYWGRAWVALEDAERYRILEVIPPLWIYAGMNIMWGIIFTGFAVGLWRQHPLALKCHWPAWGFHALVMLIWYQAFAQSDYDRGRLPFLIVLIGIGLTGIWWLQQRSGVRRVFIEE